VLRVDPALAFRDGRPVFAAFGDSDRIEEGDFVMAMGSPLSLSRSVSFGIVSCRDRVLSETLVEGQETGAYNTWIQTDAAINPGNSGGPLVNLDGEVVGVNTRASLGFNNIGFAIPGNVVRDTVAALLRFGAVPRATLGIRFQPLEELDRTALAASEQGVLVAAVDPGSPAERADVRPGDILVALGGEAVRARFAEEIPAVQRRIAALPVGRPAALRLLRGGDLLDREALPEPLGQRLGQESEVDAWGITVQAVTEKLARELALGDTSGVLVTGVRPGSAAAGKVDRGDVLREMDGIAISDLAAFQELARARVAAGAALVRLKVQTGGVLDVTVLRLAPAERER